MSFLNKIKKIYYFFRNPVYKIYCFIFRPKSFGVKILIENDEGKFLMVKINYSHKKWTFPGGGVNKGESFKEAAVRELKEETGIESSGLIEIGEYFSLRYYKKNTVKCFYAKGTFPSVKIDNFEITQYGWYDLNNIPEDCSFAVSEVLEVFNK